MNINARSETHFHFLRVNVDVDLLPVNRNEHYGDGKAPARDHPLVGVEYRTLNQPVTDVTPVYV